jgi:hypothetical protein
MSKSRAKSMDDALLALVTSSLTIWARTGTAQHDQTGVLIVACDGHTARISRAAPGVPFRWSVTIDGRERVASSVTGLLRVLRSSLDPDFKPSRVRIAPLEIAPP